MSYLTSKFKGLYRIKVEYDQSTNMFPRKLNGTLEDIDCYIDCYNNIRIFYYGKSILEAYVPSLIRGHNILKAIKEELNESIILYIEETSSEVLFRFHANNMSKLEKYLKPKTAGANISPFSTKNLPKTKYSIPDEDLVIYKNIVQKIGQNRIIELTYSTNNFIKSLATKKNTYEDMKADMALKGLKGKNYIHSIGQWDKYIKYLEKELCQI